jgi:hypothetical protein
MDNVVLTIDTRSFFYIEGMHQKQKKLKQKTKAPRLSIFFMQGLDY